MELVNRAAFRRCAALLALLLSAALLLPGAAQAESAGRIVRVGWFESPFNSSDELGRRSGYAYEYQQKLAAYAGWTYEYVEGSWSELLQMLSDGRIDLLSDVSYTPARAEAMLYSSLPMGAEEYYLFAAPGNEEITLEDYRSFSGRRVGVNAHSVQRDLFLEWAEVNEVQIELVELNATEEENLTSLNRGEIDLYVGLEALVDFHRAIPLCKIGSSSFFFAVSSARHDLLAELNAAMIRIQDENPYYNQQLSARYLQSSGVNLFLSAEEKSWLSEHGTIRVGYQDDYLAFCAQDSRTGALNGALKDYLEVASDCLENAHLDFEAIAFPSAAAALDALKRGEVDCVFPANLTDYDGEQRGVFLTPALMRTDVSAVVRAAEEKSLSQKERVTVAVNADNPNYDIFLQDHFPAWRAIYFADTAACLRAVADGQADCLLLSNYRFNNIAMLCEKYRLVSVSTGVEMDYCLAVDRNAPLLYSILAKITSVVPSSTVQAALSHWFTEDAKTGLVDLLRQNKAAVFSVVSILALVLVLLMVGNARLDRKAAAARRLVSLTETDKLTGLYSKNYFFEYAERLWRENPGKPMDAIVLNLEQFGGVNTLYGRRFGDGVLQALGSAVLACIKENGGLACRAEADSFLLLCPPVEDCPALLERLQGALDAMTPNLRGRLRMGVRRWQPDARPAQLLEQAAFACEQARGSFQERLCVYDDKLRERELFEQQLLSGARAAVESREMELWLQPRFELGSEPPKLESAEALLRWRRGEQELLEQEDFLPLLERGGQLGAVDGFLRSETALLLEGWKARRGVTVPLSIRLTRAALFDPMLEDTLNTLLADNGLTHGELKLIVPESVFAENAYQLREVLERLHKTGYAVELDGFGSSRSSLRQLSSLPLERLTLGRELTRGMERDPEERHLAEMLAGIARGLNLPVAAAGVDSAAQARLVKELGCTLAQGQYFCPPLSAAEFEEKFL